LIARLGVALGLVQSAGEAGADGRDRAARRHPWRASSLSLFPKIRTILPPVRLRVADTSFSPGDDFCNVWHLFDLIAEGASGWLPKFGYTN